jgi:tripartite-type tricarboxylate transporter receptor subunit TctC
MAAKENIRREDQMGRASILALAMLLADGSAVGAQESYPSQTVKVVVPAAAGSTTDTLARLVADQLSRRWGKPAVVENVAGGGMNIGARAVARAAPDGHTLLVTPPAPVTIAHLLTKDLDYSPTAFVPITMLAKISNVLVARKTLPANSLQELIAYAKANPGKLTYATQGPGSTAHLSAAQLESRAGIKMVAVPYRGAQLALNDVIAGTVDLFFDTLATSVPLFRGDKIKLLAVAGSERAKTVPELPTFPEAGVPDFRSITWFGLVAPPATPAALAQRLNRDAVEILRSKEVLERLQSLSLEVGATSPADTTKFFADEAALWSTVIREAGITPR